jgi:alcohol dehydrogenase (cytochrome c)
MKLKVIGFILLALPLYGGVSPDDIAKVPAENWLSYSGDYSGRRFSALAQIRTDNVGGLTPQWVFHVPGAVRLEVTPIVLNGVMYVTNSNEVYALDANTGRSLWHYKYASAKKSDYNRGVAILGDRLFFVSSDAHLIALQLQTGAMLWDVEYARGDRNYSATLAPLAINGKVVVGVSGGDCGVRGFIDAYDAATGKRAWRFWTVPEPGDPAAASWGGHPSGGATWMTGTYDPAANLLFWTTGNPGSGFYGRERPGDNLYSDCLLALDADTGKLKWHFQFTPHDTHDWDAEELPVLLDATVGGSTRHLLVQADRNGFFYELDRVNGQMLKGTPFVDRLTWARGVLPDGRPDLIAGKDPTPEGNLVCPGNVGATNWFSPSYSPQTGLFYVNAIEECDYYFNSTRVAEGGGCSNGTGITRETPHTGNFVLKAIDIQTGAIRWKVPLASGEDDYISSMPGTLATAGRLVFFGDDAGYIAAANAETGTILWSFQTGQMISASPMTYAVNGRQFVAIASATDVFAFALFRPARPLNPPVVEEKRN